jgi:hypothetical protein
MINYYLELNISFGIDVHRKYRVIDFTQTLGLYF